MIEHIHPDGEPTPTVRELYERKDGSAEATDWVKPNKTSPAVPTKFRLLPKGQAIISAIARRNAAATLARGGQSREPVLRMIQFREEKLRGEGNGSTSK
ncbi:hypothetical protein SEA_PHINKY_54 [Microbacterium phage Phinky]|nr:hypothetical protein SEA_PHINKY_54 [Microbacterium phage Phinky]